MNNNTFANALNTENAKTKTWNGADALNTTGSKCLDFFGLIGSCRNVHPLKKCTLFDEAFNESPDDAMKLLFYARDIRGGYGERDAFNQIFAHLAETHSDSVIKNIPNVMEFGRAKDLYTLIGTPAETAMWEYIKMQFNEDVENMKNHKPVSLLAKWLATPNASSKKTSKLGVLTAHKIGYTKNQMAEYRKTLSALRTYIKVVEKDMSANEWKNIDYSIVPSNCMLKNKNAFIRHDKDRYNEFINNVNSGKTTMHMNTVTPVDIMSKVLKGDNSVEINTMWKSLPQVDTNALVVCDTSGSMFGSRYKNVVSPITVAIALSIYFAQHNVDGFKNKFFTFSNTPHLVSIKGDTLLQQYNSIINSDWGMSTNLEAVFDKILKIGIQYNIADKDMPKSILVISDMQINPYVCRQFKKGDITFTNSLKQKFASQGYTLPTIIYWNVNAQNPTFHATATSNGVMFVSGYSTNIMKQVMENIGKTPMDLMNTVLTSDRYKNITA